MAKNSLSTRAAVNLPLIQQPLVSQREDWQTGLAHGGVPLYKNAESLVSARKIHARERGIGENIMRCKNNQVAKFLSNPKATDFRCKKSLQTLSAHIGFDVSRVEAFARYGQRAGVQVRRENLNLRRCLELSRRFLQGNGQRVRLLTRSAAHRPYTDRVLLRLPVEQAGNDFFLQLFKYPWSRKKCVTVWLSCIRRAMRRKTVDVL